MNEIACFRCGEEDHYEVEESGRVKCLGCGEHNTMLTFQQALDIINNLWVAGEITIRNEPYDEEFH